jgi:hypothetical protein
MRSEPFLRFLNLHLKLDRARIEYFMTNPGFKGGWEGWLQGNIGYDLAVAEPTIVLKREVPYRDLHDAQYIRYAKPAAGGPKVGSLTFNGNQAACADFIIQRTADSDDTTHLELKCKYSLDTAGQEWGRLRADILKIEAISSFNPTLNPIALLFTFTTFSADDFDEIDDLWEGKRTAWAMDFGTSVGAKPLCTKLEDVAKGGADRPFLIAVSI